MTYHALKIKEEMKKNFIRPQIIVKHRWRWVWTLFLFDNNEFCCKQIESPNPSLIASISKQMDIYWIPHFPHSSHSTEWSHFTRG